MDDIKVIGFRPPQGLSTGVVWEALDAIVEEGGARPLRHWQGAEISYLVVEDLSEPASLRRIAAEIDVVGKGRWKLEGVDPGDLPSALEHEIALPAHQAVMRYPEFLYCPFCGGRNGKHRAPCV